MYWITALMIGPFHSPLLAEIYRTFAADQRVTIPRPNPCASSSLALQVGVAIGKDSRMLRPFEGKVTSQCNEEILHGAALPHRVPFQ
jgi:hypothetical protein